MKKVILLSVVILLICLGYSFAEVPCKINYQGRLIKDNVPVDGTKKMVFSIYNDAVAVTPPLWTSGEVDITVYNGLFRYVLDLSSLDDWTAGETLYLEVKVEDDILTPREELYAYPYAINSHLLEGATKEYFINTSGEAQKKEGGLNIMGNVGIGTTAPDVKLHVVGDFQLENTISRMRFEDTTTGHDDWRIFVDNDTFNIDQYRFDTTWTRRMKIISNGNVGIGTSSPGEKLTVAGTIESTTGGVKFPDGTLQTTAGGGRFGVWNDRDEDGNPDSLAAGVIYTAETDGLVFASFLIGDPGERALYGYTPAGTLVTKDGGWSTNSASITMPVRKGDTWKVTGQYSGNGYIRVFWMPIGD